MLLECNEIVLDKIESGFFDNGSNNTREDALNDIVEECPIETVTVSQTTVLNEMSKNTVKRRSLQRKFVAVRKTERKKPVLRRKNVAQTKRSYSSRQKTYTCHHCFAEELDLEAHMKLNHSDQPIKYQCPNCFNMYDHFKSLKSHIYMSHTVQKSYICDECGAKFAMQCRMKEHKQVIHQQIKRFFCDLCMSGFKTMLGLKLHMRSHTGEKPYKCEFCPKVYFDP